jgi:hypothetical protein
MTRSESTFVSPTSRSTEEESGAGADYRTVAKSCAFLTTLALRPNGRREQESSAKLQKLPGALSVGRRNHRGKILIREAGKASDGSPRLASVPRLFLCPLLTSSPKYPILDHVSRLLRQHPRHLAYASLARPLGLRLSPVSEASNVQ